MNNDTVKRYTLNETQQRWLASNAERHSFLGSLATQYGERGWLSEKQYLALKSWCKDPSVNW
jgi:hypothetical protein